MNTLNPDELETLTGHLTKARSELSAACDLMVDRGPETEAEKRIHSYAGRAHSATCDAIYRISVQRNKLLKEARDEA